MKLTLLLFSVLFVLVSDTQNRGVSYIGMCHRLVRGKDVLSMYSGAETINIHLLIRTFNRNGCPAFESLASDPRPMVLHISLLNGPGLRNRRLQRHEFLHGYSVKSAERAILRNDKRVLRQVIHAAGEARRLIEMREMRFTVIRVKPVLESDFSMKVRQKLARLVSREIPNAEVVDNPHRDTCLKQYLCETHGENTDGEILDLDGLDYSEANRVKWEREGRQKVGLFVWKYCNNGFQAGEAWKPPLTRTNWCRARELNFFRDWLKA